MSPRTFLSKASRPAPYEFVHSISQSRLSRVDLIANRATQLPRILKTTSSPASFHGRNMSWEATALTVLKHESIVKCYGYGRRRDGQRWLELEYVDGDLVANYLEPPRPIRGIAQLRLISELSKRVTIFEKLLAVVGFIHWKGWYHGDIQPANLIFNETQNRLVLIDFEYARPTSGSTVKQSIRQHSLDYAAPEETRTFSAGPASDLYAVGRIGLQLLSPWLDRIRSSNKDAAGEPPSEEVADLLRRTERLHELCQSLADDDPQVRMRADKDFRRRQQNS